MTLQCYPFSCRHDRQTGFTMVELIVAMVLVGVMATAAGMGIVSAMKGYAFTRDNVAVAQRAQLVMARLQREISGISSIDGSISTNACIRYERDVDSDFFRAIRYDSNAKRLFLAVDTDDPTTTAAEGADQDCTDTGHLLGERISSFSIAYLNDQGTTLSTPVTAAQVWAVQVTVAFDLYESGQTATFSLTTAIRNKGGEDAPPF